MNGNVTAVELLLITNRLYRSSAICINKFTRDISQLHLYWRIVMLRSYVTAILGDLFFALANLVHHVIKHIDMHQANAELFNSQRPYTVHSTLWYSSSMQYAWTSWSQINLNINGFSRDRAYFHWHIFIPIIKWLLDLLLFGWLIS